jgi:hypothetical protein
MSLTEFLLCETLSILELGVSLFFHASTSKKEIAM